MKTLKEIFELYEIYNTPLLETELGKELFDEVQNLIEQSRQAAVSGSLPRREAIEAFVKKYNAKIGIAITEDDEALKKEIVKLARVELGHKKSTWWVDVFRGIENAYERGLRGNDR